MLLFFFGFMSGIVFVLGGAFLLGLRGSDYRPGGTSRQTMRHLQKLHRKSNRVH